ncbi:MAG: hypothetical protein WCJ40_00330 [Planctomycetota bacterium]
MTTSQGVTASVAAFIVGLILTVVVRSLARRYGVVARPKADRWHTRPTALMGGVSIALTSSFVGYMRIPQSERSMIVLASSLLMFLIGFIDDLITLKPYQKVIGQLVAASAIITYGMYLPWTSYYPIDVVITLFWLVGITNAVNLLDNMDGLSAGISAIAATFLGLQFAIHDPSGIDQAWMLGVFAASLAGFLVFNHNPASIFMGDCGSLYIGFFLSSSALMTNQAGRSRSFLPVLAVPVLVLLIPIFDTTLVFILRKLAGRSVSQGGRDHTSHRLVALGLSERKAVWMLWACAAVSGVMGLAVQRLPLEVSLVCIVLFSIGMIYLGIHLGKVKVYDVTQPTPVMSFLVDISYKRRVFEVMLDAILVVLAYYGSYALVIGTLEKSPDPVPFFQSLPLVVAIKLTALTSAGVYRGMWRYITPDALWIYFRGTLLGSMASVVVLTLVFRFQGFSRAVFALDGLLLLLLLTGSRFGFRLIRNLFPNNSVHRESKAVMIYGAGDAGEILARELINNPGWRLRPVGFLDDDTQKKGKTLHGLRVIGGFHKLAVIQERLNATGVIISSSQFTPERLMEIRKGCMEQNLELFQLSLSINPIISHDDSDDPIQADSFVDLSTFPAPESPTGPGMAPLKSNQSSSLPHAII